MLSFFRKIRHGLVENNRISKYLLYAIGEIVLVVVGILLALQINSWKAQEGERQLQVVYLERLINDLEQDLKNMDRVQEAITDHQAVLSRFIGSLTKYTGPDSLLVHATDFFDRGWVILEFIPTTNTYTDLSQTGNLKVLTNRGLVEEIISYYGWMAQVTSGNNVNKDWITPIDQSVAKETAAFEIDPSTSGLFQGRGKAMAVSDLLLHKDLLSRDAAGHYWINTQLYNNLDAMKGLAVDLIKLVKSDLNQLR